MIEPTGPGLTDPLLPLLRPAPVIALTADVMPDQQRAALDAGVDEILTKPLDLDRLVACLSEEILTK